MEEECELEQEEEKDGKGRWGVPPLPLARHQQQSQKGEAVPH